MMSKCFFYNYFNYYFNFIGVDTSPCITLSVSFIKITLLISQFHTMIISNFPTPFQFPSVVNRYKSFCQFSVHPFGFISPSLNSLSSYISPCLTLLCISPSLSHQLYLFSLPQSIAPSLPPPFPTPAPQPSHHSPNASHCPQPPTCHYCHLAMLAFPLQPSHSPSSDVPPPIHITTTPIFCAPSLSTPPKRPSSHH